MSALRGLVRWWRATPPAAWWKPPHLRVPTVNIGQRQAGRIVCENVLCCPAEEDAIAGALAAARSPELGEGPHGPKAHNGAGDQPAHGPGAGGLAEQPHPGRAQDFTTAGAGALEKPAEPAEEQKQA